MDIEAGKTLTNEEVIRELLELLKKNAMKEQANDVFEICSYVDGLEKKIDSMTEELTNMQNQIKEMQEDTLVNNTKKALSEAQERLNARCEQIKSQVLDEFFRHGINLFLQSIHIAAYLKYIICLLFHGILL